MTINPALYSSASGEWETPQDLYDQLDREFHFDLDPCATAENAKCGRYFTKAEDGLVQPWLWRVYVNPPYGRGVGKWVEKCYIESCMGAEVVVALLPVRTDTQWFYSWVNAASEIRFLRGRLKFGGAKNSAPFPSMIVVWRGRKCDT